MIDLYSIGNQFARIVNGKCKINKGACSVDLQRHFTVLVQGRVSHSVVPVGLSFESLDQNGTALNIAEISLLEEEIPAFIDSIVKTRTDCQRIAQSLDFYHSRYHVPPYSICRAAFRFRRESGLLFFHIKKPPCC